MNDLEKWIDAFEPMLTDCFDDYHAVIQRYLLTTDDAATPDDIRKAFRTLVSACVLTVWRDTKAEPPLHDVEIKLTEWLSARYRDNILFLFDKSRKKTMSPQEFAWRSQLAQDEQVIAEALNRQASDE